MAASPWGSLDEADRPGPPPGDGRKLTDDQIENIKKTVEGYKTEIKKLAGETRTTLGELKGVWDSFLSSLLRAFTDFLAAAAVKGILNIVGNIVFGAGTTVAIPG